MGCCGHGNDSSGSVKIREFLQLGMFQFFKKHCAVWSKFCVSGIGEVLKMFLSAWIYFSHLSKLTTEVFCCM
jgi:hypothetical protein